MLTTPRSAENRLNSCKNLRDAEGLRAIIIRTKPDARNRVGFRPARAESQQRHLLAFGAELLEDGVAGHSRKHEIEHDEIGVPVAGHLQSLQAILDSIDVVPFGLEAACESEREISVVLDDQDPRHAPTSADCR